MAKFVPSSQQQAFFDWVKNGQGNCFLEAAAGCGKTTTLVESLAGMKGFIALIAFNKKIADELAQRVSDRNIRHSTAGTFHSFGLRAWKTHLNKKFFPKDFVNSYKVNDIIAAHMEEEDADLYASTVRKLVSLAKQYAFGVICALDDVNEWMKLVDHFDIESDLDKDAKIEVAVKFAIAILKKSIDLSAEVIDFDDMIYMPVYKKIKLKFQFDWVLVDEAQDISPFRMIFARMLMKPNARAVFVGDRCQPLGTLVQVSKTEQKKIEDLKIGDTVISFSSKDGAFVQKGRTVTGITRRPYSGKMIRVESERKTSRYTPNHYVRVLMEPLADTHVVYLMEKFGKFRVGKTVFRGNTKNSGFLLRMRQEQADNVWILKTFVTKKEALFYEAQISFQYNLPMITFSPVNSGSVWNQELLLDFWNSVSNRLTAEKCLSDHGRDIRYSMNELITAEGMFRITRPVKIRAANLMSGMCVLHYKGVSHYDRSDYKPATVTIEDYVGDVVSLSVEIDHSYIADGIATYNCQAIYAFAGADAQAVENIIREFKCTLLPLSVTYRCPKTVVAQARNYVSHIEAHETAPEGEVVSLSRDDFEKIHDTLTPRDAILCRKTAPLIKLAYTLIRKGIACKVEGKDIGNGLNQLVKKWKVKSVEKYLERLEKWEDTQVAKLSAKKHKEMAVEALQDRVATVRVLCEGCMTIDEVSAKINRMFGDSDDEVKYNKTPRLTLSTAHRSKGLEFQNVYIFGFNEYMPSPMAKQDWERQSERNLIYVAVTRAKNKLTLVG